MIMYNVTVKVEPSIAIEWLKWVNEEHIPDIINTGCFTQATLLRLLEVDDAEGPTYCVQYLAENINHYKLYIDKFAARMRNKSFEKWGNKFIAYRSVMEFVH